MAWHDMDGMGLGLRTMKNVITMYLSIVLDIVLGEISFAVY